MAIYSGPGFNIETFRSYVANTGILRTNTFIVRFPLPSGLRGSRIGLTEMNNTARGIEFACDSVNFPATGPITYNAQRYGYGAADTRPTLPKFSPLQCTFISDRSGNVHKLFHEWSKITVNYDFYNGISSPSSEVSGIQMTPYEIAYKPEYAVDLRLLVFEPSLESGDSIIARDVSFREAFPVAVSDIPFSWGKRDDFVKIPVVFAFTDWWDNQIH